MKVLAMTVCCMDIYPQQGLECVGGNSLNFATQCVRSGLREVAVLGAVGNDRYEPMIRSHLKKFKIDASHLYTHEGATASNRIYITDEGERTFHPDSWQGGVYQTFRLSPEDWDFVLEHDLVAMPCLDPNFPEALERIKPPARLVVDFLDTRDFALMERAMPQIALAFISLHGRPVLPAVKACRAIPLSATALLLCLIFPYRSDGYRYIADNAHPYFRKMPGSFGDHLPNESTDIFRLMGV